MPERLTGSKSGGFAALWIELPGKMVSSWFPENLKYEQSI
jgi:hypothetical protein